MNQQIPTHYPNVTGAPIRPAPMLSLWMKIKIVAALLVLVGAGGFYFYIAHRAAQNMVLFENSLDAKGSLVIDGAAKGELGPREHVLLTLDAGHHTIVLKGPSGAVDEGALDVPKKADFGYHGLYVLGARSGVAVVTKYYSKAGTDAAFEDKVEVVPPGTHLVELPGTSVMKPIDEPFPASIQTTKNAMSPSVTRICHVDAKRKPACPGW